ncbi:MAG: HDIG domain-containing protein [Bacteroidales bacterium]|nr:HDIG domain-containing protein [Bacteroidales bacterium]
MKAADYQAIIDKYYPAGSRLRDIYMRHCSDVAALALEIARRQQLPLDEEQVKAAAMLHDIGIFLCNAPGIDCHGAEPYIKHGPLGADLLRSLGVEEEVARVAERHTGSGLTAEEIEAQGIPLPKGREYCPQTLLEKLVCYADNFFSKGGGFTKTMDRKDIATVEAAMRRYGSGPTARFQHLRELFGE